MTTSSVSLLEQQLQNLEQLKTLLDNELKLISSRDPEALIDLLKQKQSLLDQIQQADQKIANLSQEQLADPDADELKTAIEQRVDDCKYLTEINAKAVEQGQLRLEHLRNLILEARSKESMTYNKSGKPTSGSRGGGVKA
ncbi:hypothetical protein HMF8227_00824 [Saliniradius amylolyticus]|uniref:Flagella synthesis protein FlgN n=1 Tax=Saliniradius amylolyticus TaxID=2183582 RepID=A0A2S2E151_9ALTE|nr:flagellar export chaperone FlgN [Saliniradius amylolyticus]AWL11319.1 hypothetical protein HMF8227_00824 [Saliniradius amylolyticus]